MLVLLETQGVRGVVLAVVAVAVAARLGFGAAVVFVTHLLMLVPPEVLGGVAQPQQAMLVRVLQSTQGLREIRALLETQGVWEIRAQPVMLLQDYARILPGEPGATRVMLELGVEEGMVGKEVFLLLVTPMRR